jgi:hypothetical protein
MTHPEFVSKLRRLGAIALLLTGSALLPGCSDDDADTGDESVLVFTTSIEAGHQHTVSVPRTLLEDPAQGETELLTTVDSGHQHEVELTAAELDTLEDGGSISKTTSINDGHSHSITMNPGAGTLVP